MAILAWWLVVGFFVGSLAIIWWTLLVDHDLNEEPYEEVKEQEDNILAGLDGVSLCLSMPFAACTDALDGCCVCTSMCTHGTRRPMMFLAPLRSQLIYHII